MAMEMTSAIRVLLLILLLSTPTGLAVSPVSPGECITQISAANHACEFMPGSGVQNYVELHEHSHSHEGGHNRRRSHHQDNNDDHSHNHHRHHQDDNDNSLEEPRAYRDCCRWLKEVNQNCVCEVLATLPPVLSVRRHSYSVSVGKACNITYRCGGF